MTSQTEHLKQLDRLAINIGKHYAGAALFGDINNAQEDGDANAIDELGIAEIDHQSSAT